MRKYTVLKDKVDERDILYSNRHNIIAELFPKKVDLRVNSSPVVDQGQLGSCTANAIVSGLREYILLNDERKNLIRLSRLYLYWWERKLERTVEEDSGASLRDGMKVLHKKGVCTEETRPYIIDRFKEVPTEIEEKEALNYTISGYQRLSSIKEIKHALRHAHPVVFSMDIYESFQNDVGDNGIIQLPKLGEERLGGHAMCLMGYDDTLNGGSFIVRNSWGQEWGHNGYCYMPYKMHIYWYDAWTVMQGRNYFLDYWPKFICLLIIKLIEKVKALL